MNERLILVTNDDGYASKGLAAAIEAVKGFGRVVAVAPETAQSGMSQAITMYKPLFLRGPRPDSRRSSPRWRRPSFPSRVR